MPGLYSHTTRSAGTVVTAAIYNGDHQNHIDNQIPNMTDDWSQDATQMRLTADPYPSQSAESLATSLDGELTRLRYVLGQLASFCNGGAGVAAATTALGTNLGQWYFGIRNPSFKTVGARVSNSAVFAYTTAGYKAVSGYDTEAYDQDGAGTGFHENVTNPSRLTVPANAGGKYRVGGAGQWASNADTGRRNIAIRKNGSTILAAVGQSVSATNSTFDQCVECDVALAATDYVELVVAAGANMNFGGPDGTAGPAFWLSLIGS